MNLFIFLQNTPFIHSTLNSIHIHGFLILFFKLRENLVQHNNYCEMSYSIVYNPVNSIPPVFVVFCIQQYCPVVKGVLLLPLNCSIFTLIYGDYLFYYVWSLALSLKHFNVNCYAMNCF